jgi:hypothetical protein
VGERMTMREGPHHRALRALVGVITASGCVRAGQRTVIPDPVSETMTNRRAPGDTP